MGLLQVLPALVLVSALLLSAAPAHSQRVAEFDPSECVNDADGRLYYSLYGMVFGIPRGQDHSYESHVLEDESEFREVPERVIHRENVRARYPEPMHPEAAVGCPGNPVLAQHVAIPVTYDLLGIPAQEHRDPLIIAASSVRVPTPGYITIGGRRIERSFRSRDDFLERFNSICERNRVHIDYSIDACFFHTENEDFRKENLDYYYVADESFYTRPLGGAFVSICKPAISDNFIIGSCSISYLIHPVVGMGYRFRPSAYPLHQIIAVDSAKRSYVASLFYSELSQPLNGSVDDLVLPIIDHQTLLRSQ